MNVKANITILAVVLLFGACTSDDEGGEKGLVPITFTTTTLMNTPQATHCGALTWKKSGRFAYVSSYNCLVRAMTTANGDRFLCGR